MKNKYGSQLISADDIEAVTSVLKSDFLTQGRGVPDFEKKVATYCQSGFGVAFNSATSALHSCYLALGVGPNDIVWTVPNTFVATANAAIMAGANIDFIDVNSNTRNICIDQLRMKLTEAEKAKKLPKVVAVVHFSGMSCDMKKIHELSEQYHFKILEDASHALGGTYDQKPIGNCQYSEMCVFSFHPVKMITTGEGGLVTTNDSKYVDKLRLIRSHGVTRCSRMANRKLLSHEYDQIMLGYNYRMSDIAAVLGTSQMKKIEDFVECRNTLANRYYDNLRELPLRLPQKSTADQITSFHLYVIETMPETGSDRNKLMKYLQSENIGVNLHYKPVHLQPYYQQFGFATGDFNTAETYYKNCLSIPLHCKLTLSDIDEISDLILNYFQKIL